MPLNLASSSAEILWVSLCSDTDTQHWKSATCPNVLDNSHVNAVYNWLAPEILAGKKPSKKSDVYSLAVVLHEMLSG